jgi:phosphoglycolate phosphatase-like HAD superfamily hydrolase
MRNGRFFQRTVNRADLGFILALLLLVGHAAVAATLDPLPSWNEGAAKTRIIAFVQAVTDRSGKGYVAPAERIATFDNDGTLWSEQPIYSQFAFALDRVKAMAPQHPDWATTQPFKAVLEGDTRTLLAQGEHGLAELVAATHSGMTTDEFRKTVDDWVASARHPKYQRPYTDLVYQPMLELLGYLRANGFKTYIVSGGGVDFMRPWTERVYGIPPEQVVGSTGKTRFEMRNGEPVLVKLADIDHVDDGPGKPIGIQRFIGRRPIAAFGNSDGDLQMLQYAAAGSGSRLALLVHHTDAQREAAYDRASAIGKLDKALDEAAAKQWVVVDIKQDWKKVFPFQ